MPRLLVMVSRKGKSCPLVFSSSKLNCMVGLIEFAKLVDLYYLYLFIPTSNLENALFFEVKIFVNVVEPCVNSSDRESKS